MERATAKIKNFIYKGTRFSLFQLWHATKFSQKREQQIVFILGHMRSGSSLLLHLLIAHPELEGCGERNAIYRSEKDFKKLIFHTRFAQKNFRNSYQYFVDQINHNHHTPDFSLLKNKNLKLIFLIRKPEESISSILKLSRNYYDSWPPEKATQYYIDRLNFLGELATYFNSSQQICLVSYQGLICNTSKTLQKIKMFLNLKNDLKENYKIHTFTGSKGDPSPNIKTGKIIRKQNKGLIPISGHLIKQATLAYEACYKKFS